MRGFVGSGHKQLIPMSILGGGSLCPMIADLISRIIIAPEELQSVSLQHFRAPFFLYLIRKGEVWADRV